MPIILLMERRPFGLSPVTEHDREELRQLPPYERVQVTLVRSRSRDMTAFYWALIDKVAQGTGWTKDALSTELLIRTGTIHCLTFKNGDIHVEAKSIAKMPQDEFREYVDAAIELVCREYISGMQRGELIREVERMVGVTYAPPQRGSDVKRESRPRRAVPTGRE